MMAAIVGSQMPTLVNTHDEILQHASVSAWSVVMPIGSLTPSATVMAHALIAEHKSDITEQEQRYRQQRERRIVGWTCYLLAITQYLIIGLVTSRDRAMDVLSEFDRAVAQRRRELIEEFHLAEPASPQRAAKTDTAGKHGEPENGG